MADKIREPHRCPFCDDEIAEAAFPYCEACQVKILSCPQCQAPVPRDEKTCPQCGCDIKEAANRGS